jgi:hypothetical protein
MIPSPPEFVSSFARQSAPQWLSKTRKALYLLPWLYPHKSGDETEALEYREWVELARFSYIETDNFNVLTHHPPMPSEHPTERFRTVGQFAMV